MKTKIVYVVSSNEKDIYLEQALLSVFSLRQHNPNAHVELVVDQDTDATIVGKRQEIMKYIDKRIVVNVPDEFSIVAKSRWLKTSLRRHVEGNFLYIDTDTVISDTLEDIDAFDGEIGAVKDQHVPIGMHSWKKRFPTLAQKGGWTYREDIAYYNSGVLFVKDSELTYNFFQQWHQKWMKNIKTTDNHTDQSSLAATNETFQYVIKELSGEWNCQILLNGLAYLANARIMHYLAYQKRGNPWIFYHSEILNEVKVYGYITETVSKYVGKAKTSFTTPLRVIYGYNLDLWHSPLLSLCRTNKSALTLFNFIAKILGKLIRLKRHI